MKYVAPLRAGLSRDDVKIVILRNLLPKEDHAAIAARVDGQWLILDNRRIALVRDTEMVGSIPEFVLDEGARGASSRQIEPGRGQVPADRARPASSGLLSPRRKRQERNRRAAARSSAQRAGCDSLPDEDVASRRRRDGATAYNVMHMEHHGCPTAAGVDTGIIIRSDPVLLNQGMRPHNPIRHSNQPPQDRAVESRSAFGRTPN